MNSQSQQLIQETAAASSEGRLHFPQVIQMLVEAGVESYHVDYRAGRSTYYLPEGGVVTVDPPGAHVPIPIDFDIGALQAAIRGAQEGSMMYPEFKRVSQAAGCASYSVWISGRHVAYFGRKGDVHLEPFPTAP